MWERFNVTHFKAKITCWLQHKTYLNYFIHKHFELHLIYDYDISPRSETPKIREKFLIVCPAIWFLESSGVKAVDRSDLTSNVARCLPLEGYVRASSYIIIVPEKLHTDW